VSVRAQLLEEPVRFAERYTLLELIAVGGMAEIYRARQDAMAGFEKDVVIKRLKPELATDPRMVEMFLDEARISALLNHPNIVHVYDVGEQDGTPFIAMELIVGEELMQLCRRGLGLAKFLPLPHAVDLVRQAAQGMGYFHAKRGVRGEGLDIVHCDISPNNLLVTEDGGLKIIDFGIARARNQRYRDHGALPGKVSYMSPEQASMEPLDHRSDIFALGVVLYEITVGKRLFRGPADQVVQRVRECKIEPPTFVRQDYPGQLESVVMRALERHPDERYESAYDIADDLFEFLRDAGMKSGALRIARYLDVLNEASGGERRTELIAEAERGAADLEDDLDFDRGMFDAFQAHVGGTEEDATEWDEVDEVKEEVAAALGVSPDKLDSMGAKHGSTWPRAHSRDEAVDGDAPDDPDDPDDDDLPDDPVDDDAPDEPVDDDAPDEPVDDDTPDEPAEERELASASRPALERAVRDMVEPSGLTLLQWGVLAWAVLATVAVLLVLML